MFHMNQVLDLKDQKKQNHIINKNMKHIKHHSKNKFKIVNQ